MFTKAFLRSFFGVARDRRGVAALEFAIVAPVVLLLALGVVEVGGDIVESGRAGTVAARVGDLVTREENLSRADLVKLLEAVPHLADDANFNDKATVFVSVVTGRERGGPRVAWQQRDAGRITASSRIGSTGSAATLPADVTLAAGETIIGVEVFAAPTGGLIGGSTSDCTAAPSACTYKRAFYRGRYGDFAELASR